MFLNVFEKFLLMSVRPSPYYIFFSSLLKVSNLISCRIELLYNYQYTQILTHWKWGKIFVTILRLLRNLDTQSYLTQKIDSYWATEIDFSFLLYSQVIFISKYKTFRFLSCTRGRYSEYNRCCLVQMKNYSVTNQKFVVCFWVVSSWSNPTPTHSKFSKA